MDTLLSSGAGVDQLPRGLPPESAVEALHTFRVLQVCPMRRGGGAEAIASALCRLLPPDGLETRLAVGDRRDDDADVFAIPNDALRSGWARRTQAVCRQLMHVWGPRPGARLIQQTMLLLGQPKRWLDRQLGHEDFDFPATHRLDQLGDRSPDLIHAHNLHGEYFDLRALPQLSKRVPLALTLHDGWLLSGHCAHSFGCDRWLFGCGQCPDLTIPPAVVRDGTAYNWARKRDIYNASRLYVATPSNWLMERVQRSILGPAVNLSRVIPNGVDVDCFSPFEQAAARKALELPLDAPIVLFAAHGIRQNPWKDFATLRSCLEQLGARWSQSRPLVLIALGDSGPVEQFGSAILRLEPFLSDRERLARFYQSTDVYVHVARADTFPSTVLEALSCGVPVVATAVGGIPEQVRSLTAAPGAHRDSSGIEFALEDANGVLTTPRDSAALAKALEFVLSDGDVRMRLAENARCDALRRFDEKRMVRDYLDWYREIVNDFGRWKSAC